MILIVSTWLFDDDDDVNDNDDDVSDNDDAKRFKGIFIFFV